MEVEHMNNDAQYWFPAKRFGWGWGPPTVWQGWVVLAGSFIAIGIAAWALMPIHLVAFLSAVLLIALLLLLICYAKGEPPAWRPRGEQ
jgi:hypothetical protein